MLCWSCWLRDLEDEIKEQIANKKILFISLFICFHSSGALWASSFLKVKVNNQKLRTQSPRRTRGKPTEEKQALEVGLDTGLFWFPFVLLWLVFSLPKDIAKHGKQRSVIEREQGGRILKGLAVRLLLSLVTPPHYFPPINSQCDNKKGFVCLSRLFMEGQVVFILD